MTHGARSSKVLLKSGSGRQVQGTSGLRTFAGENGAQGPASSVAGAVKQPNSFAVLARGATVAPEMDNSPPLSSCLQKTTRRRRRGPRANLLLLSLLAATTFSPFSTVPPLLNYQPAPLIPSDRLPPLPILAARQCFLIEKHLLFCCFHSDTLVYSFSFNPDTAKMSSTTVCRLAPLRSKLSRQNHCLPIQLESNKIEPEPSNSWTT